MQDGESDAVLFLSDKLRLASEDVLKKYFREIYYYPNDKINALWNEKKVEHKFSLKSTLAEVVESLIDKDCFKDLSSSSEFVFFLDSEPFVVYLMLKFKANKMILVEDGESTYVKSKFTINSFIKKIIGFPLPYGHSSYIKELEASFPERLPHRDLRKKAKKVSTDTLIEALSYNAKSDLLDFYSFDKSLENCDLNNSLVLVTQPLSEDNIVSEEEKILLYKEIVAAHIGDAKLYIKVHPREKTDYTKVFPESSLLQQNCPAELLSLLNISFGKAITLFSTAIHLVPSDEKIILGLDYNKKVADAWLAFTGKKQ